MALENELFASVTRPPPLLLSFATDSSSSSSFWQSAGQASVSAFLPHLQLPLLAALGADEIKGGVERAGGV
jgi:hypothetical protein